MKLDCTEVLSDELLLEIYAICKEPFDLKFKMWVINECQACKKWIHHKKLGLLVPKTYTSKTVSKDALNEFLKEYHSD
eukprot:2748254-Ditylum_brightwellii.AAC.1